MATRLNDVSESGVAIDFLPGNRDFLLGEEYCRRAGMRLLEEPVRMVLGGESVLLMHGDTLCTDDLAYQRFRKRVRDPAWQQRMLRRPAGLRRFLARLLRLASHLRTRGAAPEIMDVNPDTVRAVIEEAGVDCLIHGHTHRPAVHELRIGSGSVRRIVLGDWFDQGSVIEVDDESIRLVHLPRD